MSAAAEKHEAGVLSKKAAAAGDSSSQDNSVMGGPDMYGEVTEFDENLAATRSGAAAAAATDLEKQKTAQGEAHFNRLGWKRLTIILIVEAIALGSLSLPKAFAELGMVAGALVSVGLGFLAIYTSDIVGQVKIKFPEAAHYADAGRLVAGRVGYEVVSAMFVLQLVLLVGSHCLTGTIAFGTIVDISRTGTCSLVFGGVSAVILLVLAIPPSFAELAILGYIDFVSIVLAIGITIIATGVQASRSPGLAAVPWSAWPRPGIGFADAFIAVTNIVFAYSFSICQFSFMDEMHTPRDYKKSIWALGLIEITIYTVTGALIYAFVGPEVKSPALLSAGDTVSRVAFGVALPVIFISGSINTTVVGRYIHGRAYRDSVTRFINTTKGWATWLALVLVITVVAFVIAESIPFFSDLLSISSSLFVSGFTYYFPPIMWVTLIKEGPVWAPHNRVKAVLNLVAFVVGLVVLVGGTYSSIVDIMKNYRDGTVGSVFTCKPIG